MNEVIKNIMTRRSIRDFSEKTIAKSDMEVLVKTALTAPSGMNKQSWKITAVLNQEIIAKLAGALGKVLGNDKYCFYNATALIITSNDSDSKWGRDDNACALENVFLAAHSMGIGSVWINQLVDNYDKPEIKEILSELGVPNNHAVYGVAALGYSSSQAKGEVEKTGDYIIIE